MTLSDLLIVASALFCVGVYGLLTRRHAIGLLLSLELMLNAANIAFVGFGRLAPNDASGGQLFALFALAITVAEVAVGLALVLLLYRRHGDALLDLAREARG
jgi:NADH:ubiquinone oxidoreductase subunit K